MSVSFSKRDAKIARWHGPFQYRRFEQMEELLPHYERELALLRQSLQQFAARYPKIAARLAIAGEHSEDPHVERMLQSFALLAARIDVKLDDDYPDFTEALIEVLFPQYLRSIPSCCIAQVRTDAVFEKLTAPLTIARGTQFVAKATECGFRSTYDVTLAPLHVTQGSYTASPHAPTGTILPAETTGLVSLGISATRAAALLNAAAPPRLRLHLAGAREVIAALNDALHLKTVAAYVEADGLGRWKRLEFSPVSAVGFDDGETLVAGSDETPAALRLLMEYFAFPEKFAFIDLDLAALLSTTGPCGSVTVHFALAEIHKDSWASQRLARIGANTFQPFCTPVVNVFKRDAASIKINPDVTAYSLLPSLPGKPEAEIFSIDGVSTAGPSPARKTVLHPVNSLMHGSAEKLAGPYWTVRRDRWRADAENRGRTELVFVGLDGEPVTPEFREFGVDMTCTNGDLPASLPIGMPGGDLQSGGSELGRNVAMLSRPTQPVRLPRGDGALWRLIGQMAPHTLHLSQAGLEAFKQFFRQFATLSQSQAPHIDGIVSLDYRPTMQWIAMEPSPAFVRGIEITATVDEHAFASSSLRVFAGVMDRFFAPYAPANSFVQVVLVSKNIGAEIWRCPPREGAAPLI
jgi:type VI secretion system protein ImpG